MGAYIEMNGGMQFMIVDPLTPNVEAMKLNLKKMGYKNFTVTPDAFAATNHIRTVKTEFIICRLNLKDVSGSDFMEELKNDLTIPRIPFMMFSEHMDEGDLALLAEIGVDAHLTIPFVTKDLAEKVMATWSRYIDPKNPEFHFEAARRLFLSGKIQESADAFVKIATSGKLVSRSLVAHGRAIAKLGKLDDALKIAQKVRKDYPKFVHGHQFSGEVLVDLKREVEALECFFAAIALSPKNPYRYQIISEILLRMQRFSETEIVIKKAIEANISLPFVYENMAQALIKQEKKQEALSWYQKLVDHDKKNPGYHNNIAVCYKKLGNMPKALEHYQIAADVSPKDARVRFNLALALLDSDKKQSAINTLKETISIDKNHDKAKLKLMELTDPKAFAAETAKRKAAEEKQKKDEEAHRLKLETEAKVRAEKARQDAATVATSGGVTAPAKAENSPKPVASNGDGIDADPSKFKPLSKQDEDRLAVLIGLLVKLKTTNKSVGLKPLVIPEAVQTKLKSLKGATLRYHYGTAAMTLRKQLFKLMAEWFQSLMVISEELAVDIGDIIQNVLQEQSVDLSAIANQDKGGARTKMLMDIAEKASATDNKLKDELMPIIMDLQFQDYLRQALGALQKTFRISYEESDVSSALKKMEKCLVTVADKNALKSVFGVEINPPQAKATPDAAVGDGLFFDAPAPVAAPAPVTAAAPVSTPPAVAKEPAKPQTPVAPAKSGKSSQPTAPAAPAPPKEKSEPQADATSGDILLF
jgi:tetratricopeptide (TPR) repeat protein